jgi:hypothetical protein
MLSWKKTLKDTLQFGKYKGYTIKQAIWHDAQYIQWCIDEHIVKLDQEAKEYLQEHLSRIGDEQFDPDMGDRW